MTYTDDGDTPDLIPEICTLILGIIGGHYVAGLMIVWFSVL